MVAKDLQGLLDEAALLHLQQVANPTLFALQKLPPPPTAPRAFPVPDVEKVNDFKIYHTDTALQLAER